MSTWETYINSTLASSGYYSLFVLMFLESAFLIIPSETIMVMAGFLAYRGFLNLWLAVAIAALGNVAGSFFLYKLAEILDRRVTNFLKRYVSAKKIDRAEQIFRQKGYWSIFFAQFIPGIRTLISLPAGLFNVNLLRFFVLTYSGAFLWNLLWMGTTYMLGGSVDKVIVLMKEYEAVVMSLFTAGIVGLVLFYLFFPQKVKRLVRMILGI